MRAMMLIIFGVLVASVLAILIIKPFSSSDGRGPGAVTHGPIEQPEPKP